MRFIPIRRFMIAEAIQAVEQRHPSKRAKAAFAEFKDMHFAGANKRTLFLSHPLTYARYAIVKHALTSDADTALSITPVTKTTLRGGSISDEYKDEIRLRAHGETTDLLVTVGRALVLGVGGALSYLAFSSSWTVVGSIIAAATLVKFATLRFNAEDMKMGELLEAKERRGGFAWEKG